MKGTVKELGRYPVTAITGVNTLFNAWLHNPEFRQLDFSKLNLSVGGGMPVQSNVAKEWEELTGKHLLEGYGLTECSPLVTGNPYNLKNIVVALDYRYLQQTLSLLMMKVTKLTAP